jgi:predicted RNase H-like HicB family nuclease
MSTYTVVYERAPDGSWSAAAAGLPVFAVGQDTRADAERAIRDAIALHLQEARERGEVDPVIETEVGVVTV